MQCLARKGDKSSDKKVLIAYRNDDESDDGARQHKEILTVTSVCPQLTGLQCDVCLCTCER